jgi:hypothetical protein
MKGLITGKHVFRHTVTLIRLWGVPTYFRCVRAALSRKPTTFLAVIYHAAAPRAESLGT